MHMRPVLMSSEGHLDKQALVCAVKGEWGVIWRKTGDWGCEIARLCRQMASLVTMQLNPPTLYQFQALIPSHIVLYEGQCPYLCFFFLLNVCA